MTQQHSDEKEEEKEEEKRGEKGTQGEKWEEKGTNDPLGSILWALILIWAGVVLLGERLGYLERIPWRNFRFPGMMGPMQAGNWTLIIFGAGCILMLGVVIRLIVPEYRRPLGGNFLLAVIFLIIGVGGFWSMNMLWPVILIIVGLWIIIRGISRRR